MIEYIFSWIIVPSVISYGLTKYFYAKWVREGLVPSVRKKGDGDQIASLVFTELVGEDVIAVCFEMGDGSKRNFQCFWLRSISEPNDCICTDTWKGEYDFRYAVHHAARLHMRGKGRVEKNVYDSSKDWRLQ